MAQCHCQDLDQYYLFISLPAQTVRAQSTLELELKIKTKCLICHQEKSVHTDHSDIVSNPRLYYGVCASTEVGTPATLVTK